MRSVVVTQVYNEEYLLPWWLTHHRTMFDHGVILDYASTDSSLALYQELVPAWDVISLGATDFSAEGADGQVMDIESQFEGWKISLNATEFLCCQDFEAFTGALEADGSDVFSLCGVVMVDPVNVTEPPTWKQPLTEQRSFGYFEHERIPRSEWQRNRIFHRASHGHYDIGRHRSHLPTTIHPPGAIVVWFGFSPWTEQFVKRKLQIQERIPDVDRSRALGKQHMIDRDGLETRRLEQLTLAEDLSKRKEFTDLVRLRQGS